MEKDQIINLNIFIDNTVKIDVKTCNFDGIVLVVALFSSVEGIYRGVTGWLSCWSKPF